MHRAVMFHNGDPSPLRALIQDIYKAHLREVVHYNKVYKPTIGADIRQDILALRAGVNRALRTPDKRRDQKISALRSADIALENLRDGLWTASELKCVSEGQLSEWCKRLDTAGKMIGGWIKALL